jgi:TRAP-type C4-dicarboxylate transport system permease small subunit
MNSWFKPWGEIVDKCVQNVGTPKEVATLSCIPAIFANLLNALLTFAGLIALFMFIVGGYKLMNSAGDPKKTAEAQNNFKYGILGLIVVLSSFLLINLISIVTGVECIKTFGFGCN